MRFSELLGYKGPPKSDKPKYKEIDNFEIWTTNEERALLEKLKTPIKLSHLEEVEQFRIEAMIRKSLVTKIGMTDPMVVANEKAK